MSGSDEHRSVGFVCACGDSFETPLGYRRHRSRCDELEAGR